MTTVPVSVGDVLVGKYVIEHTLGEGGMGVVFAARHTELDRRVAIKFLLPEFAQQGMAAERFRREARAAARIRGEHVCRVLDVGTLDTGVPFMVMEFLDGGDLASELAHRARLPVAEAVGYVLEACEAVAEAHVSGIVHRDLKPANLFLETRSDGSRRIKVLDFGVSKSLLALSDGNKVLTTASSLVGSPLYMSPEQLECARDVDARADIWALGVVLYELVTGVPPFQGDTIPQLVAAVLHDSPVRMPESSGHWPAEFVAVLRRALAKRRDQRYSTVAELAQALSPFASPMARVSVSRVRRLLEARSPTLLHDSSSLFEADGQSVSVAPVEQSKSAADEPAGRRSKLLWAGTGLTLLCLLAALALSLWRSEQRETSREAAARSQEQPAPAPAPATSTPTRAVATEHAAERGLTSPAGGSLAAPPGRVAPSIGEAAAPSTLRAPVVRSLAGAQSNVPEQAAPMSPAPGKPALVKTPVRASGRTPPLAADEPRVLSRDGTEPSRPAPADRLDNTISDFGGRR